MWKLGISLPSAVLSTQLQQPTPHNAKMADTRKTVLITGYVSYLHSAPESPLTFRAHSCSSGIGHSLAREFHSKGSSSP